MNLQEKEALFAAYIEGELTPDQQATFNALCESDNEFDERINNSNTFNRYAAGFSAPTPPRWNKEITFFEQNKSRGWLQSFSLSGLAVAMSACALLAVLTGAQISIKDNGVALTFAHETNASDVDALVSQKVAEALGEQREYYQVANQQLFKEYAQALSTQQQQSSAELTQYLLTSSREERKQDFSELLKFINDQRIDDQRFYARQFSKLQDEIDDIEMGYSATMSYPVLDNTQPSVED